MITRLKGMFLLLGGDLNELSMFSKYDKILRPQYYADKERKVNY